MATSKLFIACSGRTLEIAKQLRDRLNPDYCETDLWNEVSQDQVGTSILAMLKAATKEYDFALIILAKDDVFVSQAGETLKARDNCVFEAGLFMGALGEDRCFLLSSVAAQDLPSDLGGIIFIPFTEPADLEDLQACRRAVQSASVKLDNLVRKAGPVKNRPLSREKLLERARRNYEGGELLMDQVVVASGQPPEVEYEPARQMRKNIDSGNIRYVYFFEGNSDGAVKTCQLLQQVLLANILKTRAEADDWSSYVAKISANKEQILADMKRICQEERIKVFFLPKAPALQYCIHNAANDKLAKLYLKHDDEFIEWASGKEAYDFWQEVKKERGANSPEPEKAVFYGVPGFHLGEDDFYRTLKRAAGLQFPGIGEEVMRLCLEGPKDESKQG